MKIESAKPKRYEEDQMAFPVGAGSKYRVSQEGQKKQIFNTLENMSNTMRSFTDDIEARLEKLYGESAEINNKFGLDDNSTSIEAPFSAPKGKKLTESERNINRIAKEAQEFLKNNSVMGSK